MTKRLAGDAVIALFYAAIEKFGQPSTWNRPQVSAWIQQQMREATGQAPHPAAFDAKTAALGEREAH